MNNSHSHKRIKNFFTKNIGLKIFSLAIASLMWFLVMNTINPTETRSFTTTVSLENIADLTSRGYVVNNQEYLKSYTVSIKVEGSRPALDELAKPENKNAISAKIDLSKIEVDANAEFPQKYQVAIVPSLPSNLYVYSYKIASYFPTVAEIEIDELSTTSEELKLSLYGNVKSGFVASDPVCDVKEVEVYGPASKMSQINSVVATVDITNAESSVIKSCEPVVYDANNNVLPEFFVNPESVQVEVDVDKENKIKINQPATIGALPGHLELESITWEPKTIMAKSSPNHEHGIEAIDLPPIDLTNITKTTKKVIDVSKQISDLGLSVDSSQKNITVTINVSVTDAQKYTINKSLIKINGLSSDLTATISEDVVVEIGGIAITNIADLNPTINLSNCKLGKNTVPLSIKLPDGATLKKDVTVSVLVGDKIKNEPETSEDITSDEHIADSAESSEESTVTSDDSESDEVE